MVSFERQIYNRMKPEFSAKDLLPFTVDVKTTKDSFFLLLFSSSFFFFSCFFLFFYFFILFFSCFFLSFFSFFFSWFFLSLFFFFLICSVNMPDPIWKLTGYGLLWPLRPACIVYCTHPLSHSDHSNHPLSHIGYCTH